MERQGEHRHSVRREAGRRRVGLVLAFTASFMVAEAVGGWLTGSLALLADAGHMLSDVGALSLALLASWYASRPPTPRRTFGYYRAEVLSALANGTVLLVLAGWVAWGAVHRLHSPREVLAGPMLGVAVVGLGVNLAGALLLARHQGESLNIRGAFFHVLGDLLGSLGAITAGTVILLTGWTPADALISLFIAILLVAGAVRLVWSAVDILLESTPAGLDLEAVCRRLEALPGVRAVHDLHIWTLTGGVLAMSGHIVVEEGEQNLRAYAGLLDRVQEVLSREFGIAHATLQLEPPEQEGAEPHCAVQTGLTLPRG